MENLGTSKANWYGSRLVNHIIPEVDYFLYPNRYGLPKSTFFQDLLSLTKINRTGTFIASLIGGVGFAGGIAAGAWYLIAYGAITIILMYLSIAILNDVIDLKGDMINEPGKPLARGVISANFATGLSIGIFLLGLLVAFSFSELFGIFYLVEFAMGIIYCYWAKGSGIASYALMGFTHIAFPFLAGTIVMGAFGIDALLVAAYVYLTMFLGIVIKDFKDIEGDKATKIKTFPIIYGIKNAYKITVFGFLLAPLTFFIPWIYLGLPIWFLVLYALVAAWKLKHAKIMLGFPDSNVAKKILNQFRFAVMGEMLAWGMATI
ncbi:UbiA family prenyltransferase [Candidatus Micrarchaeota archaeon]|nr:UbiA family prenyltransferase [Candidatus Micrarchaeota archaeon]